MKTLVTTLLLLATINLANASDKKENQTFAIEEANLNKVQNSLISNYLHKKELTMEFSFLNIPTQYDVVIYSINSEVVFKGTENEASGLLEKSTLITTYNKVKSYIIVE